MALYLALQFEAKRLNYNFVFGIQKWKQFQEDVDAILAADGYAIDDEGWAYKDDKAN